MMPLVFFSSRCKAGSSRDDALRVLSSRGKAVFFESCEFFIDSDGKWEPKGRGSAKLVLHYSGAQYFEIWQNEQMWYDDIIHRVGADVLELKPVGRSGRAWSWMDPDFAGGPSEYRHAVRFSSPELARRFYAVWDGFGVRGLASPHPFLGAMVGCASALRVSLGDVGGVAALVVVMAVVWLLLLCWYDACAVCLQLWVGPLTRWSVFVVQVVQVFQAAPTVAPRCTDTAMWARIVLVSPRFWCSCSCHVYGDVGKDCACLSVFLVLVCSVRMDTAMRARLALVSQCFWCSCVRCVWIRRCGQGLRLSPRVSGTRVYGVDTPDAQWQFPMVLTFS